ncbi:DNA-J related domain-containing protein [Photobacterium atrarenae]|uniref:DnaJ domain-containing protein n=1 Tax=Photobacterium atrarenae TaxID=865757 RepID=A0ABY5GBH1_9GAMM|nr:DNA-J related domain-containing protein [Photobacterium atrarenae]UTV26528.1 DnaJ domain-containing protein [Photobacterium atrarenae]
MDLNAEPEYDNPLIWPILSLLNREPSGWKVHTLFDALKQQDLLEQLDDNPEQDLFKRNFLLMNALYQLQALLLPSQWLQVQAMDIQLLENTGQHHQIDQHDPLRRYYLDWHNYHTDAAAVKRLLSSFWSRYQRYIGHDVPVSDSSRAEDLARLALPDDATPAQIRRQWRKLALRWHPDRPNGDADTFRQICEAWQRLQ